MGKYFSFALDCTWDLSYVSIVLRFVVMNNKKVKVPRNFIDFITFQDQTENVTFIFCRRCNRQSWPLHYLTEIKI
jgi:hypothetical protein